MGIRRFRKKLKKPFDTLQDYLKGGGAATFAENLVPRMKDQARAEVIALVEKRVDAAKDVTEEIRRKMVSADKHYRGIFEDAHDDEDAIYMRITRQHTRLMESYLTQLVRDTSPLVTAQPVPSGVLSMAEEMRRAKLRELLFHYYFEDVWNFRDEIFPELLRDFLKYPSCVVKIAYDPIRDDVFPQAVDRGMLYVDTRAPRCIENAKSVVETFYLERDEVMELVELGHWSLSQDDFDTIALGADVSSADRETLQRIFGNAHFDAPNAPDLIECREYWENEGDNRRSVYACVAGDKLVRFGEIHLAGRKHPYVSSAYDPGKGVDGESLVETLRDLQDFVNTIVNLRRQDIQRNAQKKTLVAKEAITPDTKRALEGDDTLIPVDLKAEDLQKLTHTLPYGTVTDNVIQTDLPFAMSMMGQTQNITPTFQGQQAASRTTKYEYRELAAKSGGAHVATVVSLFDFIKRCAETLERYFDDPEFFDAPRVVNIVGPNRYADVVAGWELTQNAGRDSWHRMVLPEEIEGGAVRLAAVSGAEAVLRRSEMVDNLREIMQAAGQHPEWSRALMERYDVGELFSQILSIPGFDMESVRLTEAQRVRKAEEERQRKEAAWAEQQRMRQMEIAHQQQLKRLEIEGEIALARAKSELGVTESAAETRNRLTVDQNKIRLQHRAKLEELVRKIVLEEAEKRRSMVLEADLEKQAGVTAVTKDTPNVQQ